MRFEVPMKGLVQARVSQAEKRAFREAARRRGISISEFLRQTASEAALSTNSRRRYPHSDGNRKRDEHVIGVPPAQPKNNPRQAFEVELEQRELRTS